MSKTLTETSGTRYKETPGGCNFALSVESIELLFWVLNNFQETLSVETSSADPSVFPSVRPVLYRGTSCVDSGLSPNTIPAPSLTLGYGIRRGCPATMCCRTWSLLGPPRPPQSTSAWQPSASWASLPMSATAGTEQTHKQQSLCTRHWEK